MVDGLRPEAVRRLYDGRAVIWKPDDRWHYPVHKRINAWVREHVGGMQTRGAGRPLVLNAGAGDNDYGLPRRSLVNLDISTTGIAGLARPVNATVTRLPFGDASFDAVVCSGSVVNYAGLRDTLAEAARVLRPEGLLVGDCELSGSWEYLFTGAYRAAARAVTTTYDGREERVWVFSLAHVETVAGSLGLRVVRSTGMHYASSAALRLTGAPGPSSLFRLLDPVFRSFFPRSCAGLLLFAMRKGGKQP